MSLSSLCAVYIKEMRSLFRDRHTLIYTVALPAFLYPVIFLGTVQGVAYLEGLDERRVSTVAVAGDAAGELVEFLERREREGEGAPRLEILSPAPGVEPAELLADDGGSREADAVVVARRAGDFPRLSVDPLEVRLFFSAARDSSMTARERIESGLEHWRRERLEAAARELDEGESFLDTLAVEMNSLSTPEDMANFVAGLLLPLLMIFMTTLGAFYPSLESTVGEKERSTLETTLLSPVPRSTFVFGKYLAVTTASFISFGLNLAGMSLTLANLHAQLPLEGFHITLRALVLVSGAAVLLAAFVSSIMMLIAFLARTFQEGQAYLTPVYVLALVPVFVTTDPQATLTPGVALVPLVNSALLFRDALHGSVAPLPVALTFGSSAFYALVALWTASRVLAREEIATGGEVSFRRVLRSIFHSSTGEEAVP